jgi:hypothetical protein
LDRIQGHNVGIAKDAITIQVRINDIFDIFTARTLEIQIETEVIDVIFFQNRFETVRSVLNGQKNGRTTEMNDFLAAARDQFFRGEFSAQKIIAGHRWDILGEFMVNGDNRDRQAPVILNPGRIRNQDDPIDVVLMKHLEIFGFPFLIVLRVANHQTVIMVDRRIFNHFQQIPKIIRGQMGDNDADDSRLLAEKRPRQFVGNVFQSVNRIQNQLFGGFVDIFLFVDDAGNRRHAHVRQFGDVFDGGHGDHPFVNFVCFHYTVFYVKRKQTP